MNSTHVVVLKHEFERLKECEKAWYATVEALQPEWSMQPYLTGIQSMQTAVSEFRRLAVLGEAYKREMKNAPSS